MAWGEGAPTCTLAGGPWRLGSWKAPQQEGAGGGRGTATGVGGAAIPNTDQWKTGACGGGEAPGNSPPARGAPVFLGSRSLQVTPEKGATRERLVWHLRSIRAFPRCLSWPGPRRLALMRLHKGACTSGHRTVLSAGHCETQNCHTASGLQSGATTLAPSRWEGFRRVAGDCPAQQAWGPQPHATLCLRG